MICIHVSYWGYIFQFDLFFSGVFLSSLSSRNCGFIVVVFFISMFFVQFLFSIQLYSGWAKSEKKLHFFHWMWRVSISLLSDQRTARSNWDGFKIKMYFFGIWKEQKQKEDERCPWIFWPLNLKPVPIIHSTETISYNLDSEPRSYRREFRVVVKGDKISVWSFL